ncbi:hypothetical protein M514_01768, partial [Trichuris suis]
RRLPSSVASLLTKFLLSSVSCALATVTVSLQMSLGRFSDPSWPLDLIHEVFLARDTVTGCHFLPQWIMFCQNSPLRPFHLTSVEHQLF